MVDMLVKLYNLPPLQPSLDRIEANNIIVRPARIGEEYQIIPWISNHFPSWEYGVTYAIHRSPCSLFIAVRQYQADPDRKNLYELPDQQLVGFSCYDTVNKGMFGPIGVHPSYEGQGIGKALLLTALHAMWTENYAYAVIGWAGAIEWYERLVNAQVISDSEPGPFRGMLKGI